MATCTFAYPRQRLVAIVGITRMVRFGVLALLAWRFGERIVRWAKSPSLEGLLIGPMVICIVGSVISVYGWIRKSRKPGEKPAGVSLCRQNGR